MYSWRIVRLLCVILLALPILHLGYVLSRDAAEIMDTAPDAFQRDLDAYLEQDARNPPPDSALVVVGGRRVRLWQGLEQALAPRPVLMRGLGDAVVEDIAFNYQHLIGFYNPHSVLLLPGTSEFLLRANKSGQELADSIRELAELDASHGVTEHFYIISPLKTPLRPQDNAAIDEAMRRLSDWAESHEHSTLLDANALLAGPNGRPNPIYFRGDGMQLNEHGYLRLTVLVHTRLEQQFPLSAP